MWADCFFGRHLTQISGLIRDLAKDVVDLAHLFLRKLWFLQKAFVNARDEFSLPGGKYVKVFIR